MSEWDRSQYFPPYPRDEAEGERDKRESAREKREKVLERGERAYRKDFGLTSNKSMSSSSTIISEVCHLHQHTIRERWGEIGKGEGWRREEDCWCVVVCYV
jgi:hypothetical protein